MSPLRSLITATCVFFFTASIAAAQDAPIGSYMALIGPEDLVNSSGTRLTTVGAIIAQDRANYHKFGIRHRYDESDPWFTGRGHRMSIPDLVQVNPTSAQVIVRQGALVAVTIYATPDGQMTRMTVEIPG